jgi:subtilisin-like proprotein convertase family protein
MMFRSSVVLFLVLFSACQPERVVQNSSNSPVPSGSNNQYSLTIPQRPVLVYEGDKELMEDLPFSFFASDEFFPGQNLNGYTFSLSDAPSWMSINSLTGEISGIPTEGGEFSNVKVLASSGGIIKDSGFKTFAVNGDPLRIFQWHLENNGQNNFANQQGVPGHDINLNPAWWNNFLGEGIKIAVSDMGVEINHPDLHQNMLDGWHRDYSLSAPYLGNPAPISGHGTSVSGIIAATGWNNLGVTGVAPLAKIAGFQFIDSNQTLSMLIDQASGNFDIFNYSYGDTSFQDLESDPDYLNHLKYMAQNGRNGKGSFFIKAAGNEYKTCLSQYQGINQFCTPHNANLPLENESPYLIVVGAVNAIGKKSSYSNSGSNLWVSAPGGEFGLSAPAIMTTDWTECSRGMSTASSLINDFEYDHPLNTFCDYTSTMNGSSSAVPMVSGAIAVILSAKPDLTWRDLKGILAKTSTRVDSSQGITPHPTPALQLTGHSYELGWVQNAAGYWFNNWYGFGVVNVQAAISEALSNQFSPLPPMIELNSNFSNSIYKKSNLNLAIPDAQDNGVSSSISVAPNLTVESVQIKINVTHPQSGQLGLVVTSPSGTKSILMNINNSLLQPGSNGQQDKDWTNLVLTSHAFYGESSSGTWQLKLIDGKSGQTGNLLNWSLNILGH